MSYLSLYDWPTQKVTGGVWSTDGVLNANFPLANVDTDDIATPAIFTTNPTEIVCDLSALSSKRVDLVTLPNCIVDAGHTVAVKMNNANSGWTSPSLSTTIACSGLTEDGFGSDPYVDLTSVVGYLTAGYNFLRLEFASNSVLLKLKVRLSGVKHAIEHNFDYGFAASVKPVTQETHPIIERTSDAGIVIGYGRGTRTRTITGGTRLTDTGFAALQSHYRVCLGRLTPFLWVNDPNVNEALVVRYGAQSAAVLQREFYFMQVNDVQIDLQEVGRGLKP